jgi:hypothetical protein
MADTLPAETDETIDLAAFVDYLRREVDARDEASVLAAAPKLRALANHRTFLRDALTGALRRFRDGKVGGYVSQTFQLARAGDLYVRANVWYPEGAEPPTAQPAGAMTLYGLPHDHAFSFLTVGYWGPGYETSIYEYDPQTVLGEPGEDVDLRFLETTTLPTGKVMFYRASRDVHAQGYPPAFSISLNVTVFPPSAADRNQLYFDLENRKIAALSGPVQSGRVLLCRVAAALGDGETEGHLEAIAARAASPYLRLEAYRALASRLSPSARVDLARKAMNDPHPRVREVGQRWAGEGDG